MLRGSLQQFLRLLKLCTLSLQNFIGIASSNVHGFLHDRSYLIQESFNTIGATIILLIDEYADVTLSNPGEGSTIVQNVFDLLLFIVTVPQSSITLTRALGAVCLAVDEFAVIFLWKSVAKIFSIGIECLIHCFHFDPLQLTSSTLLKSM